MSASGVIRFKTDTRTISALLDEQAPQLEGGSGGWQEIQRPRRDSITEWQGRTPMRITVGILLDSFRAGKSVEADISALEILATPVRDRNGVVVDDPPVIRIEGNVPHTERDWVIDSLVMGESEWLDDASRCRQQITVGLLEYIPGPRFGLKPREAAAFYRVKAGDTYGKIAAVHLGGRKNWSVLRRLNPGLKVRTPTTVLPTGKIIRRPIKGWKP